MRMGSAVAERRQTCLKRSQDGRDKRIALVRTEQPDRGNHGESHRGYEPSRAAHDAAAKAHKSALSKRHDILRLHAQAPPAG